MRSTYTHAQRAGIPDTRVTTPHDHELRFSYCSECPYDPLKDLAPISLINTNPLVLVLNPKVEAKSAKELVELSKRLAQGMSYGTFGAGGLMQFAAETFRLKTGSNFTSVPYRGGALATQAVVAGEVQLAFSNMSDAMGQLLPEPRGRSPSPPPPAAPT